jgi:hypothetical protein
MEPNVVNSAVQVIAISSGDVAAVVTLLAFLTGSILISLSMMARRNRVYVQTFPIEFTQD